MPVKTFSQFTGIYVFFIKTDKQKKIIIQLIKIYAILLMAHPKMNPM